MHHWKILGGVVVFAAAVLAGCGGDSTAAKSSATKPADKSTAKTTAATTASDPAKTTNASSTTVKTEKAGGDHSGWWCAEHGIPEEECSMCSDKVAKDMKAKGDWCEKHDRAMSQCFICKPERRDYYAAKYRAKYGKEPPPTEDQEKKETKKG